MAVPVPVHTMMRRGLCLPQRPGAEGGASRVGPPFPVRVTPLLRLAPCRAAAGDHNAGASLTSGPARWGIAPSSASGTAPQSKGSVPRAALSVPAPAAVPTSLLEDAQRLLGGQPGQPTQRIAIGPWEQQGGHPANEASPEPPTGGVPAASDHLQVVTTQEGDLPGQMPSASPAPPDGLGVSAGASAASLLLPTPSLPPGDNSLAGITQAIQTQTLAPPDVGTVSPEPPSTPSTPAAGGVASTQPQPQEEQHVCAPEKLWALALLSATYVHQASTGFSVPVMLPMIADSLSLTDLQGAALTSGYSYLYALALLPVGLLADRVRRPQLLGAGVAAWSALTLAAGQVTSFWELMATRVGLAAAQSTQNVICFSMIPELFPKNKSTALAFYNCAIYLGRGLMYLSFNGAREHVARQPAAIDATAKSLIQLDAYGNILVPLDKLDLRLVQLVYTSGDMAAIRTTSPIETLSQAAEVAGLHDTVWREVLQKLALPGALLATALLLTVGETRKFQSDQPATVGPTLPPGGVAASSTATTEVASSSSSSGTLAAGTGSSGTASAAVASSSQEAAGNGVQTLMSLLRNRPLMVTTMAAALNDVASYALIAWQSTLYERVYHLEVTQYAPVLAAILPLSGIVGGVGGGLLADRLSLIGQRAWVTVATSLMAAPLIWASLSAHTADESFIALSIGFALSEAWRAPAAVMARSVVPVEQTSTAMSVYLCVRNIIGGLGPLLVAEAAQHWGLQHAMQLLPPLYLFSAALFWQAEQELQRVHPTMPTASEADAGTVTSRVGSSGSESDSSADSAAAGLPEAAVVPVTSSIAPPAASRVKV